MEGSLLWSTKDSGTHVPRLSVILVAPLPTVGTLSPRPHLRGILLHTLPDLSIQLKPMSLVMLEDAMFGVFIDFPFCFVLAGRRPSCDMSNCMPSSLIFVIGSASGCLVSRIEFCIPGVEPPTSPHILFKGWMLMLITLAAGKDHSK
ncbi:hypothetical protein KP509_31G071000 [Ceratopteris richardii]|uniref:Uncharacterized protein n=1 Tax=Ceratopteris richardii TaxID=49495 RepID=A0A8T2R0B6_CERRI|nr:hypothetical protein KP509_31G071000 [Ceratopteris richardii]